MNTFKDSLWNTVPVHIVGFVEITCGLCVPCMPAMYTLSQRVFPRVKSYWSQYGSRSTKPLRRLKLVGLALSRHGSDSHRRAKQTMHPDASDDSASDTRVDSASISRGEDTHDPNDRTNLWGWTQAEKGADEEEGLSLPHESGPPGVPPKDKIRRTTDVEVSRCARMETCEKPGSIAGAAWPR